MYKYMDPEYKVEKIKTQMFFSFVNIQKIKMEKSSKIKVTRCRRKLLFFFLLLRGTKLI